MNWKYPVTLAVFLGLLLPACKKPSDSISNPAQEIEPLTVGVARPGDTLVIKGKNINTTANSNVVRFGYNGTAIVSISPTEIKIVLPTSPGLYQITVSTKDNTFSVGSILITPLTYYALKNIHENGYTCQLITINPQNGKEELLLNMVDKMNDVIYNPVTNEILGVNSSGSILRKVNASYGTFDASNLPNSGTSATGQ